MSSALLPDRQQLQEGRIYLGSWFQRSIVQDSGRAWEDQNSFVSWKVYFGVLGIEYRCLHSRCACTCKGQKFSDFPNHTPCGRWELNLGPLQKAASALKRNVTEVNI